MSQSLQAAAAPLTFRSSHFGRWLDAVNQHFVPMDGEVGDRAGFPAAFRVRRTRRGAIVVGAGGASSVRRVRKSDSRLTELVLPTPSGNGQTQEANVQRMKWTPPAPAASVCQIEFAKAQSR